MEIRDPGTSDADRAPPSVPTCRPVARGLAGPSQAVPPITRRLLNPEPDPLPSSDGATTRAALCNSLVTVNVLPSLAMRRRGAGRSPAGVGSRSSGAPRERFLAMRQQTRFVTSAGGGDERAWQGEPLRHLR